MEESQDILLWFQSLKELLAKLSYSPKFLEHFEKKHLVSPEIKNDVSEFKKNSFYLRNTENFERNNTKSVTYCTETVASTGSRSTGSRIYRFC